MITGGYEVSRLTEKSIEALKDDRSLLERLTEVARSGFESEMTYEDVRDHVLGGDILYLISKQNVPVGFASFLKYKINYNTDILYLEGIVIEKEHQKQGLFRNVISEELKKDSYDVLAMRTQNPVIYAATKHLPAVDKLLPNGFVVNSEDYELANRISEKRYAQKIPNDFVMRAARSSVFTKTPSHPEADMLFNNVLKVDIRNGDYVFLMAKLRVDPCKHCEHYSYVTY